MQLLECITVRFLGVYNVKALARPIWYLAMQYIPN